jgi:hypothetical protein
MGLEKYYHFIINPNTKTFDEFIKNIDQFKKIYKLDKKKLENLVEKIKDKHLDSKGELKFKADRKGPVFSATCFPLNFKLPTLHQLWITSKSGNKQVWKLFQDYDFKQIINKNNQIESFQFNKKTLESEFELKKVENKLNTTGGKLAIGEYAMYYEKVKSDYYSIWEVGGSLITVPFGTSKDSILKAKWVYTNYGIPVDGGTFGFHNGTIFDFLRTKISKKKLFGEFVNRDYGFINSNQYKKDHYWIQIYGKDLSKLKNDKLNNWIDSKKLSNELVGYYKNNGYGDGFFNVYKSGEMFLILSAKIYWLMNHLNLEYFQINIDN